MHVAADRKCGEWAASLANASAPAVIAAAVARFGAGRIALAASFGVEDQVLTHMLRTHHPAVPIFTLDTGRLPQSTYDVMEATAAKYHFAYDVLYPDTDELSALVREHGPNAFYHSRELRERCCHARKVAPLKRKLATLDAWLCGLRREQSLTRASVQTVEWDAANGLAKINPLAAWSSEEVWNYVREHEVPVHALHAQGYPSIGCAPCTRAVKSGEDIRAGRWWWEAPEHRECGLHKCSGAER